MQYKARTRRPRARFWIAGGFLIGFAFFRTITLSGSPVVPDWFSYAGAVCLGVSGVSIIVAALRRPYDDIDIEWTTDRVEIVVDGRIRFQSAPSDIIEIVEDGTSFYVWKTGRREGVRVFKRTLNEFALAFMKMKSERS